MMSDNDTPHSSNQFSVLGHHMENYHIETSALHRKLQSKNEALGIMRKELERFRTERDQFKLMAETLQLRYSAIKRTDPSSKSNIASLLHETRERNIRLTTELEALKQKLCEMKGDIELLRGTKTTRERRNSYQIKDNSDEEWNKWKEERTKLICHLENLKKKNVQLSFDLKALIDEKEELAVERDAYKCKSHRLNHELLAALKANETHPKFLDIDSIVLENKYLHEKLKSSEEQLDLAKQMASKYKTMLESKRKKGIIKLGSSSNDESILSHKQVQHLLESGVELPSKTETIQDLKSMCLTLLDNLNDKSLALSHQKKTNKILGAKIAELERRIQTIAGTDLTTTCSEYSPSHILLQGYCPALVDSNDTPTTTKGETTGSKNLNESETTAIEHAEYKKPPCQISEDGMSSLSTGSARSVQSSEYSGVAKMDEDKEEVNGEFASAGMYDFCKSTTSKTNSGKPNSYKSNVSLVSSAIEQERLNDLKDLPPELADLVLEALHELDLREFESQIVSDRTENSLEKSLESEGSTTNLLRNNEGDDETKTQ